jgi:hypothetical protein
MRFPTVRLLLAALTASLVLAPSVGAKQMTLKQQYSAYYHAVKDKHGTRAPGRNIRRYGIRFDIGANHRPGPWSTRDPTYHELGVSIRQLKVLLRPAHSYLVRRAVPPGQPPAGVMSSSQSAPAGGPLSRIAACESGGNPRAVNPNGHYGKYQFDLQTWASVGGSGNPVNASEGEQDKRAAMLYAQRGSAPWACKP